MAKYYYNGVLLSEIPTDVLAEYPHAVIVKFLQDGGYRLYAGSKKTYFVVDQGINKLVIPESSRCRYDYNGNNWDFVNTYNTATYFDMSKFELIWSNHDIPNGSATSTTIYFYGNSPVAAEPETPSERSRGYLVRSGSTLYTITDGALTALAETEITASLFQTYGVDEIPDGSLLVGLTDPDVLYWQDSEDELPTLTMTVTGSPPVPQIVITSTQDMSDPSILGIESATVDASDDVLFAISFDDGVT